MKKILTLVLSSADGVHEEMVQSIRQTWGTDANDDFRVMYYYSLFRNEMPPHLVGKQRPEEGKTIEYGDTIVCGCLDGMYQVTPKTMMAFKHILDQPFDYLLRCCSGSYIVRNELSKFLADKPTSRFYCGVIGRSTPTRPFASGSGFILSKDLVRLIVDKQDQIDSYGYPGDIDDVAIGRLLCDHGVEVQDAPRVNESTTIQKGQYHYHFRTSPASMHEIHSNLSKDRDNCRQASKENR
jgi:hypothetical protein